MDRPWPPSKMRRTDSSPHKLRVLLVLIYPSTRWLRREEEEEVDSAETKVLNMTVEEDVAEDITVE